MAKTAKNNKFYNNWQALAAKPEVESKSNKFEKVEEPYKVTRENSYLSMFPSDAGEKYSFFIVPSFDGKSFIMTEVMTIKRFKFKNPKTQEDYFENLKIPMDPKLIFDMSVIEKASTKPNELTEEDKKTIKDIKRHADLVKRYKDLFWCKVDNVNLGYSPTSGMYTNRLKKESLTGFFGVPTKWKGTVNTNKDYSVKFIQSRHSQFQENFRTLLQLTSETHDELQPTWFEDYFSTSGGVKGVLDVSMGSMKVGGKGVAIKLVKLGKDPIEDRGVGVSGEIDPDAVKIPTSESDKLSHLHYYMGFKTNESLWQEIYVDKFEEAIEDLENHVKEIAEKNKETEEASTSTENKTF